MEIIDTQQVSAWTGVPVGTLRYWRHANKGGPPSFSLGRRVVYRREAVALWLEEQERTTSRGRATGLSAQVERDSTKKESNK